MDSNRVYKQVQDHYGSVARGTQPASSGAIARAFGYTEEELNSIPRNANLGLSCGNPLAIASLREGETVIDLGSGAGFDVFLAAKNVGLKGRAIGVDMNRDMLARARTNQAKWGGGEHVSFVEGRINSIPLEDGIGDCIISNCVINLVPEDEKPAVFAEMARLLKPGGRVAISDILARKPFPQGLRQSVAAYVGCVAGCSPKKDYERFLAENGFRDIVIVDMESDLNVYTEMADEKMARVDKPQVAVGQVAVSRQPTELILGPSKRPLVARRMSRIAAQKPRKKLSHPKPAAAQERVQELREVRRLPGTLRTLISMSGLGRSVSLPLNGSGSDDNGLLSTENLLAHDAV